MFKSVITCLVLISALLPQQKPLAGYEIVTVRNVVVDKPAEKLPAGYDTQIQERIVDALRKKKIFAEVINALLVENDPPAHVPAPKPLRKMILETTIIEYKPGNRALRYTIGWGTGATKIKARFTFRDEESGRELLTTTQQGKFHGFINVYGPGRNHSASESSGDVIDALIREINKQR